MSLKTQFTTVALATTLVFAGGAKAAPASMSPDGETVSVRVSLADLDLRQEAGMAVAQRRIQNAAAFVCGAEPSAAMMLDQRLHRICRKAAADDAMADLNTQMAALRDSESGPKATTLAANH